MAFGEIVCGAPGSGKSTYCYGKHQLFSALQRPVSIVNLDPANEHTPYPCAVDVRALVTLEDAMDAHGLGPNGATLFCIEHLDANFDWLAAHLAALAPDAYVLFDTPGQVELTTTHDALRRIVARLSRLGFRLAAVHLCDALHVTDAAKYVSVVLLSLRTMLQLELPHVNVLAKIDLLPQYGDLDFNLDFYTEVQDLSYLTHALDAASPRFAALNAALVSVIEDFGLVGFETLAVEDKASMLRLSCAVDRATGHVFVPPPDAPAPAPAPSSDSASARPNAYALFSTAVGPLPGGDVRDVQERWVDAREAYDAFERRAWRHEGETLCEQERARGGGGGGAGG